MYAGSDLPGTAAPASRPRRQGDESVIDLLPGLRLPLEHSEQQFLVSSSPCLLVSLSRMISGPTDAILIGCHPDPSVLPMNELTRILSAIEQGDPQATEEL